MAPVISVILIITLSLLLTKIAMMIFIGVFANYCAAVIAIKRELFHLLNYPKK